MPEEAKDERDDWRYILLLFEGDVPVWLETNGRLPGLPQGTSRIKVGKRHYLLEARSPFFDSDAARMTCFLEIRDNLQVGDCDLGPEGELTRIEGRWQGARARATGLGGQAALPDTTAFIADPRFRQLAGPFERA